MNDSSSGAREIVEAMERNGGSVMIGFSHGTRER